MQYLVTGHDGNEYGPSDLDTLKTWVAENRLAPHTMLRDFNTGQTMPASSVSGLFAELGAPGAAPAAVTYPRIGVYPTFPDTSRDHGGGEFVGMILRSVAGIVSFYFIGGLGFIFAGYAMWYAVQTLQSGSKYGIPAVIIAGLALVAIGIGRALRMSGAHV